MQSDNVISLSYLNTSHWEFLSKPLPNSSATKSPRKFAQYFAAYKWLLDPVSWINSVFLTCGTQQLQPLSRTYQWISLYPLKHKCLGNSSLFRSLRHGSWSEEVFPYSKVVRFDSLHHYSPFWHLFLRQVPDIGFILSAFQSDSVIDRAKISTSKSAS